MAPPVANAIVVSEGTSQHMQERYGLAAGEVPETWNNRKSVVKPPSHYKV